MRTAAARHAGSARPATAARITELQASADERLVPYGLIALGGVAASLIVGQSAFAVLAVPFALALALGLRRVGEVEVTARITLDSDQLLEDDRVKGRVELEWNGDFDADVMLHRFRGVTPVTPAALSWSLPTAGRRVVLPIELRAAHWGRHAACEVWVRLKLPFGLLSWTGNVVTGPIVRVLPERERLNRLLDPAESRAVLGMHRSRRIGDGGEFAELRPYSPGDRLRDLNWSATARHGRPFVNRHHPDLSSDVVIVIDGFADGSTVSTVALARAARAAWALASIHLRANDRVGLAGLGGRTQWLPPAGGRLARYRLLETLLWIGGEAADPMTERLDRYAAVPAAALIIALTPLQNPQTVRILESWHARGRSVGVVMIDTRDLLAEAESESEALARRVWRLELDGRMSELAGIGIPVVAAPANGPMMPVVSALRRARRAPAMRRGR